MLSGYDGLAIAPLDSIANLMQRPRSICVVEDDPAIRRGLVDCLTFAGFSVIACADGASARRTLECAELDLVLLDVVLPGLDGIEYLPTLRSARPTLPVILVTARGAEEDRVRGLRNGADDYVVKPFSSTELIARVEAVLRRSPARPIDVRTLKFRGGHVDFERREIAFDDDRREQLTDRESALLVYLVRHHGRAIERSELLRGVWGIDPRGIDTRTIDMAVVRLRDKLGECGGDVVLTVRGKGYMLGQGVEVER